MAPEIACDPTDKVVQGVGKELATVLLPHFENKACKPVLYSSSIMRSASGGIRTPAVAW